MSRDKQQPIRGERMPHPPSKNQPTGYSRQQSERGRPDTYNNVSTSHRIRNERQIFWENDLYERQSV
jgi:hypothetical protein